MYIPAALPKRQFTGDPARDIDITIGIIVAVLLTAFIAGVGYFLYRYRDSIRFSRRRRHHRGGRRRKSMGSSKSAKSTAGEEPPPQPPAAPPGG